MNKQKYERVTASNKVETEVGGLKLDEQNKSMNE